MHTIVLLACNAGCKADVNESVNAGRDAGVNDGVNAGIITERLLYVAVTSIIPKEKAGSQPYYDKK